VDDAGAERVTSMAGSPERVMAVVGEWLDAAVAKMKA
jgi:hypothetical protein